MHINTESFPVLTTELARRIEACNMAFWHIKLAALQELPDNPYGVHFQRFGHARALLTEQAGNSPFVNRVGNITDAEAAYLDAIIQWYQTHNVSCQFDIVPALVTSELLKELAIRGFYQSAFYTALYGLPDVKAERFPHITIRQALPEERDLFTEMYLDSFEIPPEPQLSFLSESVRLIVGRPDVYCLFALIEQQPAAIAILYVHEKTGYMATAGTLPQFRGKGCQQALLEARIMMAAELGCDIIVGHTGITTLSQRNMEKVGMRIGYTKAVWTPLQNTP